MSNHHDPSATERPSFPSVPPSLRPSVLFFGMPCAFSGPPLAALIAAGIAVTAVVVPGGTAGAAVQRVLPGATDALSRVAAKAGIPVLAVRGTRRPEVVDALAALRPDVLVVACFPWRLPPTVLAMAAFGGLNVHPSLLPELRGPEPVFWALRRGMRQTGVTIHRLDDGLDTGPIVAQESVAIEPGARAPDLEQNLAEIGGTLLVPAVRALVSGNMASTQQDNALATAAPLPGEPDWLMPTNLPAGWAYSFARGVAPLGGPLAVLVMATGERIPIADALDVDPFDRQDSPLIRTGNEVAVQFKPGVVRFRAPN